MFPAVFLCVKTIKFTRVCNFEYPAMARTLALEIDESELHHAHAGIYRLGNNRSSPLSLIIKI
jgi:hypothetical protein